VEAADGRPSLAGRVESRLERPKATTAFLLLDQPARGTAFASAEGMGDQIACSLYLYLYDGAGDEVGQAWTAYITDRFPALQNQP
jgi:hypothetical protein